MAAGQWRVGIGAILEFTFLDDAGFSLEGKGTPLHLGVLKVGRMDIRPH